MAIIQCYECGADVSDQAQSCPHCGAVQSKWARVKAEQKAKTQAKPILSQEAKRAGKFNDEDLKELEKIEKMDRIETRNSNDDEI